MRAPALALLLLALAPLAGAQGNTAGLTIFAEEPGGFGLMPGTEVPINVQINYQPGTTGRPAPAPSADRPEDTQPTRITIGVKQQPSWVASVRIEPAEILVRMPAHALPTAYRPKVTAYVNVSEDAPALVREPLVLTATADANGNIPAMEAESPELVLKARTVGKLNVTAPEVLHVSGGRWTTVPFTVRNEGNSEILAKLNVTVRPENSQVQFVDTLQLAHNATQVVEVRLRTPWTNAEIGTLELEAVPIVDGEPAQGSRAEVDVRGQSAVPAPGALLALLLVALLARRR